MNKIDNQLFYFYRQSASLFIPFLSIRTHADGTCTVMTSGDHRQGVRCAYKKEEGHYVLPGCVLQGYSAMRFTVDWKGYPTLWTGGISYPGKMVVNRDRFQIQTLFINSDSSIVLQQKFDPDQRIVITFKGIRAHLYRQGTGTCDQNPTVASVAYLDDNHIQLNTGSKDLNLILFVTKNGSDLIIEPLDRYLPIQYAFLAFVPSSRSLGCKPWAEMFVSP